LLACLRLCAHINSAVAQWMSDIPNELAATLRSIAPRKKRKEK